MTEKKYLIFDYGASHGRSLVAKFNGVSFEMEAIHEFENRPVFYGGTFYWDILRLSSELSEGLLKAFKKYPDIVSVGVDTWGCDFGFLDKQGRLLANPANYRDELRHRYKPVLDEKMGEYELFELGGANTNPIMAVYYLYALKCEGATDLKYADRFLMIPDLLNYYLTGEAANEYTNATMALLVDQKNKRWEKRILGGIGVPESLFSEIRMPGTVLGKLSDRLCGELGVPKVPVISVASHDTASAIAGVPLSGDKTNWAFISLGTWALFGEETKTISTSREVFDMGFGTQGGVDGKNNLINMITGLWIIQQCRECWSRKRGEPVDWDEIVSETKNAPGGKAFIDVQDPAFILSSPNMPGVVMDFCKRTGQHVPGNMGEVARTVYESMVLKFMDCKMKMETITRRRPEVFHVFGGGVKNKLLCQWMADAFSTQVIAGPVETTSVGNLLMQMKAMGDIKTVNEGRKISAVSSQVSTYDPKNHAEWKERFAGYKKLFG
jgi:sugar (pentulose or hexulose) kinase